MHIEMDSSSENENAVIIYRFVTNLYDLPFFCKTQKEMLVTDRLTIHICWLKIIESE